MKLLDGSVLQEEISLELDAIRDGAARYRRLAEEAIHRGEGSFLKPVERLLVHWFWGLREAIVVERRRITRGEHRRGRDAYAGYLFSIDPDRCATATLHAAVSLLLVDPYGMNLVPVVLAIARAVNAEVLVPIIKERHEWWEEVLHTDKHRIKPRNVTKIAHRHRLEFDYTNRDLESIRWPLRAQTHLGALLAGLLVSTASLADWNQPVEPAFEFYRTRQVIRGRRYDRHRIRFTTKAFRFIEQGHEFRQYLHPRHQPMILPPLKWTCEHSGGYLKANVSLLKGTSGINPPDYTSGELDTVYEGLNALSSQGWRINHWVLDVAEKLIASGGDIAGLPSYSDKAIPFCAPSDAGEPAALKDWKRRAYGVRMANRVAMSQRVMVGLLLSVAQRFSDRVIYFPYQFDFRLRAYPVPLHLNPQGCDLARGLLEFARPKPLTPRGLWWLKVHLANCCGLDKVRFEERVAWVQASLKAIEGWVANPLENTGWAEFEKPFQALAAAKALVEGKSTGLPVQIDGTCNGLQHYAALGRDEKGALLVNLIPSDFPRDIYAAAAEVVERMVALDAENGNAKAKLLDGRITRKLVKQPVMTHVYGVTEIGARLQLRERLKEIGLEGRMLYETSRYLAKATLAATADICPSATKIMTWLRLCAAKMVSGGRPVAWRTPLGVKIEQPYRYRDIVKFKTPMFFLSVAVAVKDAKLRIRKQIQSFPPNYIHSIDSSHMLCTAIACHDARMDFCAVHDCFWTHPSDADRLAKIVRQQFVEIHQTDWLTQLYEDLRPILKRLPKPPRQGKLDITSVLKSPYAFD